MQPGHGRNLQLGGRLSRRSSDPSIADCTAELRARCAAVSGDCPADDLDACLDDIGDLTCIGPDDPAPPAPASCNFNCG